MTRLTEQCELNSPGIAAMGKEFFQERSEGRVNAINGYKWL